MSTSVPHEWETLQYLDPERFLVGLRRIALTYPLNELRYHVSSLRTRELRRAGEGRQAALFAYGMGQVLGVPISFAHSEAKDHDVIVRYVANQRLNYVPVQLKEWVPDFLNSQSTLQDELDKLVKYADSRDLAVAFHLNRDVTIHLSKLKLPHGRIGELWFYGTSDPSQENWVLIGNLLSPNPRAYEFAYPAA